MAHDAPAGPRFLKTRVSVTFKILYNFFVKCQWGIWVFTMHERRPLESLSTVVTFPEKVETPMC